MKYILSIDAGTTSSRSIIFDKDGNQIGISQYEFTQIFPKEGWVEHDPLEIWETQKKSIKDCIRKCKIEISDIAAIGITNQRETTVIWDKKSGKPVYNAIVWQDRRTAEICNDLLKKNLSEKFVEKTGLVIDSYFSGTKIKWILDNNPQLRKRAEKGELAFGTIDTWLIWKMTNGKLHVTDVTNASRTLLFNITTLKWDDELLNVLNVPKNILPKVVSSSEIIGDTSKDLFGIAIPISGIAGDQHAALFGQLCINEGDIKNTYGTGCFCIMNTGDKIVKSKNKMLSTIAWKIDNKVTYAIEGGVFVAGALIQWLRDKLKIINKASEIEELASTVKNNGGVTFLPSLSGLGAPYWDPKATGAIIGITRGTENGHIALAALESIALRTREIIIEMEKDADIKFKSFKVDGGASENNLLMQIQSNFLNKIVVRPKITETTALGAAFFAGLAVGFWPSIDSLKSIWKKDISFSPNKDKNIDRTIELWNQRIK
tara:strand:+ start:1101 stop:2564 length:1464 start_codon:yes stop_codon:yes gene_type:complete